jgi:hypothetical protein
MGNPDMQILLLIVLTPLLVAASPPLPFTDSIAVRGTAHNIAVKLETEMGVPIENATIYFYHEEQNVLLGTSLTNQTGCAVFVWQVPLSHKLGPTSLNATFPGDDERHLMPCYVPIPLTIFGQTQVCVQVFDQMRFPVEVVHPDQALSFVVHVQDDNQQPLQGDMVFLLGTDNNTLASGYTAQDGSVVFKHRLASTQVGSVLFRIRSSSLNYFSGAELELEYSVEKSTSRFVGLPSFIEAEDQSVVVGRIEHEYGESIPLARIRVFLDGVQQIGETVADAQGRFSYRLDQEMRLATSGRFLMILFDGDGSHTPAWVIVGLVLSEAPGPFSQQVGILLSTGAAELVYCVSLVASASVGIGSAYLALRIRRTTTSIVSH